MTLKKIKQNRWYETTVGVGKTLRVGGTHPPTVRMNIVAPLPRGTCNVIPRDVIRELTQAEIPEQYRTPTDTP